MDTAGESLWGPGLWCNDVIALSQELALSMQPQPSAPIAEDTARVARAALPKGHPYRRRRDELGVFYQDEALAALVPARGQPAASPWRLALVLVLQDAEGLSDQQAATAVRGRIAWTYALSLEVTAPGCAAAGLREVRSRLVAGRAEQTLVDPRLDRFKAQGVLKARGRQRPDSTAVLAAMRTLNRLEGVGATLRHALHSLAGVAPDWLRPQLAPAWAERSGPRWDADRWPKGQAERLALAEPSGRAGLRRLRAIYAPAAPAGLRTVPAVAPLRRVWLQEYYAPAEDGATTCRRPPRGSTPPPTQRRATPTSAARAGSATRSNSPRPASALPRPC